MLKNVGKNVEKRENEEEKKEKEKKEKIKVETTTEKLKGNNSLWTKVRKMKAEGKLKNQKKETAERELMLSRTEVYQTHFFVTKKNRRGKMQTRFLVLSDQWLFNCKFKFHPTELSEFMWAVPYRALVKLVLYKKSPRVLTVFVNPILHRELMTTGKKGSKKISGVGKSIKESHKFIFRDDDSCLNACYVLRRLHNNLTGELLSMEEDTNKSINVVPFSTKSLFKKRKSSVPFLEVERQERVAKEIKKMEDYYAMPLDDRVVPLDEIQNPLKNELSEDEDDDQSDDDDDDDDQSDDDQSDDDDDGQVGQVGQDSGSHDDGNPVVEVAEEE